jgi:hypothetical protein
MLDCPVRFVVTRGARGAARASTLEALQEELERPFTEEELQAMNRAWEEKREARRERKRRGHGGSADGRPSSGHRRKQRPGRRERAARGENGGGAAPNASRPENEGQRGPRTPYVEGERGEQSKRRGGGLRGRRGPRWR